MSKVQRNNMLMHRPRVVAVGPRVVGGLRLLYASKLGYGATPGEVYEVTCGIRQNWKGEEAGVLDSVALASVCHAASSLGAGIVELWSADGADMGRAARRIKATLGRKTEIRTSPLETLDDTMAIAKGPSGWEISDSVFEKGWSPFGKAGEMHWEVPYNNPEPRDFGSVCGADAVVLTDSDARIFAHEIFGSNIVPISTAGVLLSSLGIGATREAIEAGVPAIVLMGTSTSERDALIELAARREVTRRVACEWGAFRSLDAEAYVGKLAGILRGEREAGFYVPGLSELQEIIVKKGVEVIGACFDVATGKISEVA